MSATEQPTFLEPFDTLGYLRSVYEPGDWVDIKLIHETKKYDVNGQLRAETKDLFQSLETLLQPGTPEQIVQLQNDGWHVYITMNSFQNGVTRRLKKNVAAIRTYTSSLTKTEKQGWTRSSEE